MIIIVYGFYTETIFIKKNMSKFNLEINLV